MAVENQFRSDSRKQMWVVWGFAVVWNAISSPVLFVVPDEIAGGNYPALFGLLFPVVGAGLIGYAIKRTREWRFWGVTRLVLDPFPGAVGGHIGGRITFQARGRLTRAVEVTVQCVHSYVSGSGKNRSRRQEIVWQGRGQAAQGAQINERVFRFTVPPDLPATEDAGNNYHFWRLQLRSDTAIPLDRAFEIPVQATGAESTLDVDTGMDARAEVRDQLEKARQGFAAEALADLHGLIVDNKAGWLRLFFPYGRQKLTAVMLVLFGAMFAAGGWWLAGEGGVATWVMAPIFALVGIGVLAAGIYVPTNSLDVRISESRINVVRKWLGFTVRTRTLLPANVRAIELKRGSSTTIGTRTIVRYGLIARLAGDGEACLAEGLDGQAAARALRDMVMEQAGLRPATS